MFILLFLIVRNVIKSLGLLLEGVVIVIFW